MIQNNQINQIDDNDYKSILCPTDSKEHVNHPEHYQGNKYECIEVMRDIFGDDAVKTWIQLNIFKYAWRANKKNGAEDIAKINWYSNYFNNMK